MEIRHRTVILLTLTAEAGLCYPAKEHHHTASFTNGVN